MDYKKGSYISELLVILIKSLLPMMDKVGVSVDYKRFQEELNLWKYYRTGANKSLLNIEGNIDKDLYWTEKDISVYSRLIPIVLANQDYNIAQEEVIKNTIYITGNLSILFETILLSKVIDLIIERKGDIEDKIKESIIDFSQREFMEKHKNNYRLNPDTYPGNYKVEFEREKLNIINLLNGIEINNYFHLKDILAVINGKTPETILGKSIEKYLNGNYLENDLPNFYLELGEYIIRLRKSRVNPNSLKIEEYILPDIFSFGEGEVFYHSLLRESQVLRKGILNNKETSLVKTKAGTYLFRKTDPN